jgi:hypothetical protein
MTSFVLLDGFCSLTIVDIEDNGMGWQFGNLAAAYAVKPVILSFCVDDSATEEALLEGHCTILNIGGR